MQDIVKIYQDLTPLIENQQYEAALHHIEHALSLYPNEYFLLVNKANILPAIDANNLTQARDLYKKILQKIPHDETVNTDYAKFLRRYDYIDEAISFLQITIKNNPHIITYYIKLGQIYTHNKQYDNTIYILQEAHKIHPNNADIFGDLAFAYRNNMDFQNSQYYYQQAMQCAPNNAHHRANYVLFCLLIGEFDKAWDMYKVRFNAPTYKAKIPKIIHQLQYWQPAHQTQKNAPPLYLFGLNKA